MFKPVSPNLHINQMEEGILRFWRHNQIFEKTNELRKGSPEYVFFERPISARNQPDVNHVLGRAIKDMFLRYRTMNGYHVVRRAGWDAHGPPIELKVERQLGLNSKQQIEGYGIATFNELCWHSALEFILDWERLTERIAYWVDLDNAYITYTNDTIESVWWLLKNLWDKGLLYQAFKVVPYCPRCGTPLSYHEVAQSYKKTAGPSVFFRLPLVDDPSTSLLIWTAKPWTLPGSVAVAVHPDKDYIIIERDQSEGGRERLILAKDCVATVFKDEPVELGETFKGKKLRGLQYRPLFTFLVPDKPAHYIVLDEFVDTNRGSGLAHISPAFNTQDFKVLMDCGLPILQTIAEDGTFLPEFRPWSGKFFKDADPLIIRDLEARGLLFRLETIDQSYPYCWHCNTALLYLARETWSLRTTQYQDRMIALNQNTNWHLDGNIKEHFDYQLKSDQDWALGRERYWGIPLPVWDCKSCHHQLAVGSMTELNHLSGRDLHELDLHRPYIDEVLISCPKCKGQMERVKEIADGWLETGLASVAQWHFPFEGEDIFKSQYPADFICETSDQTRGWLYSLHVLSTLVFDSEAFRNVVCLGSIRDNEGRKIAEVSGNEFSPWEVINFHGADAFRWYLYSTNRPNQDCRLSADLVGEVVRKFTLPLWNVYSFFITNANLDQWIPPSEHSPFGSEAYPLNNLDRWVISELNLLVKDVTSAYGNFDSIGATQPIQAFMDIFSNWYLRRSRRRFHKNKNRTDKQAAYITLYTTLLTLSKLLAPAMPLLAEELYQNLVRSVDQESKSSIHMLDWPRFKPNLIDEKHNQEMQLVKRLASLGHSARNRAGIKVRQPLSEAIFVVSSMDEMDCVKKHAEILTDELNVKRVEAFIPTGEEKVVEVIIDGQPYQIQTEGNDPDNFNPPKVVMASKGSYLVALNTELTADLIGEGFVRQLTREIQDLRKQAGLVIGEQIQIYYQAPAWTSVIIQEYHDQIMTETLAIDLHATIPPREAKTRTTVFNNEQVTLGLMKVT